MPSAVEGETIELLALLQHFITFWNYIVELNVHLSTKNNCSASSRFLRTPQDIRYSQHTIAIFRSSYENMVHE